MKTRPAELIDPDLDAFEPGTPFNYDAGEFMAKSEWGLCKDCKWWQIEPKAAIENLTLGLCIDEKLQPFRLRVSGNSGCNRFMPGKPARAEGSSEAPPTAAPTR